MAADTFRYELVILDPSLHRYIEAVEETEAFIKALFSVLMKDRKLCSILQETKIRRLAVHGEIRWLVIQRNWRYYNLSPLYEL